MSKGLLYILCKYIFWERKCIFSFWSECRIWDRLYFISRLLCFAYAWQLLCHRDQMRLVPMMASWHPSLYHYIPYPRPFSVRLGDVEGGRDAGGSRYRPAFKENVVGRCGASQNYIIGMAHNSCLIISVYNLRKLTVLGVWKLLIYNLCFSILLGVGGSSERA